MGNKTYKIKVSSPLIRAGLTIETEVSEKYVVPTLTALMDKVREFNKLQKEQKEASANTR